MDLKETTDGQKKENKHWELGEPSLPLVELQEEEYLVRYRHG